MKHQSISEKYDAAVHAAVREVRDLLTLRAKEAGTQFEFFTRSVLGAMRDTAWDGRALRWRVRLFLYDRSGPMREPVADSDASNSMDRPGETVLSGLKSVAPWIAELAGQYHGAPCAGLDTLALAHKIKSLRTLISYRKDGSGTLKAEYVVMQPDGSSREMLARCEVLRIDAMEEAPRPPVAKLSR